MFAEPTRLLLRCVLVLSLIKAINARHQQQLRRVCYFTNWSCDLLVKEAYFCLHDLDPSLCSHIIFAFAGINVTSLSLSPIRVDDESVGNVKGRYVQFNDIKKTYPEVKTLLSAGGSYQADRFKIVTATNRSRERFAYNTARYVRRWGFDGLDLDWEYPGKMEKEALTHLVKDLKSAFREEAVRTGQQELLLSIAVPVGEERVRLGYQVDLISKEADMINLMAYDFYYGAWTMTAFNSPLYPRNHQTFSRKHSVEWIVNLWINLGAPPHKINLGIAGYGQSFTLQIEPQETLPSEIQTNRSDAEPDQQNPSSAAVLRNSSTFNETLATFYNNVSDFENDKIQSLLQNNDSVRKNVQICNGNMEICVMEARSSQNISRRKRDGNGIFSHDQPATSYPSDIIITSSNSDPAGFSGNNSDEISIHENGIGTQELGSKGTAGLGTDIEMLSHLEETIHRIGFSKHKHADSTLSTGGGSQETDTHTGVNGGNSQPRHGTDDVVYGVGSKAVGPGRPGRLRHLKGQLSYPEICEKIHAGAKVAWDQEQRAPFAVLGDQWVGYENTRSVAEKVTWAFEHRLGGVMFWSLDLDDFKGDYCGQGRFPLLTSMSKTVISLASQRNRSITGNTRHFTNEIPRVERTDAVTTQKSTPVSDNNMENATEGLVTNVALINKQNARTQQIVMTTSPLSGQDTRGHHLKDSVTSFDNTSDLPQEIGPTEVTRFTSRGTVNVLTPPSAGNISDVTTKKVATHKVNVKDDVTPTSLFLPDGRKQSEPGGVFPSNEKKQPEPNDLFPSQEKKQPEPNDFFPSQAKKQPEPNDLFPSNEKKQPEPNDLFPFHEEKQPKTNDLFPSNEKKQPKPNDLFPSNEKKQPKPNDLFPSNEKKQPEPNDLFPSNEKKQPEPNDLFPSNESRKSEPTDFSPSKENKQPEPTNILLSNETEQSESIDSYPSVRNGQSEPANLPTSDGREVSEISNNYYDYGADSKPADTVTTEATTTTTTTHKTKTNKQQTSHRKPGTKKRLYRNASSNVTASFTAILCVICAVLINAIMVWRDR